MSYQVLARKWRPKSFRELVGQEHVLKALVNALDHNRLHHAYLFTGTRGVGKTTIARILAKCLNCETGVSSEPCGECSACREITEGRFVDLIEVDAASRTRVEDTRELLDNVQYSATRGRFKIYLIDEVHMLSTHSFNALLKTLEEPPEHVKFLLATTDPQKLPVTILSRCLQFNLKNMSPERIVGHLNHVLTEEMVPFDDAALWQLARAADGSMRDALSLTDQAIGFGNGKLSEADVTSMLGTIDHRLIERIIEGLANLDAGALLSVVAEFAEHAPDFHAALGDLVTLLHRIAIAQALPEALDNSYGDREQILQFAQKLAPEDVQLFYQTGLMARRDLHLAPDPRDGFEMTLLRMLAFKPQGVAEVPSTTLAPKQAAEPTVQSAPQSAAPPASHAPTQAAPASADASNSAEGERGQEEPVKKPRIDLASSPLMAELTSASKIPPPKPKTAAVVEKPVQPAQRKVEVEEKQPPVSRAVEPNMVPAAQANQAAATANRAAVKDTTSQPGGAPLSLDSIHTENWVKLYEALQIKGILQSTAANCALMARQDNQFQFALDPNSASLFDESHASRLSDVLSDYFGGPVKAVINIHEIPAGIETPLQVHQREKALAREQALTDLQQDPFVQALCSEFGGQLLENSLELKA